jgi:hypothetical protein
LVSVELDATYRSRLPYIKKELWRSSMAAFILWLILFFLCWPLALLALILYPIVWLVTLPFRIIGLTVEGVFAFLTLLIFLPFRILRTPRNQA